MKTIEYTSENGYTGILYGESSMIIGIKQPDGTFKECLHTGSTTGRTMEYLKDQVDNYPEFIEKLFKGANND